MDNKTYEVVYDGDSFIDGIYVMGLENAKATAFEILENWRTAFFADNNVPHKFAEWSDELIEEWDYMVYNCCVWVEDPEIEDDEKEVWSPSAEDLYDIGWMEYDALLINEEEGDN